MKRRAVPGPKIRRTIRKRSTFTVFPDAPEPIWFRGVFRLTFPLLPTTATTTIDTGQRIFRESAVPPERTPSENHRPIGLEQSRTGQMNAGFTLQTNVY